MKQPNAIPFSLEKYNSGKYDVKNKKIKMPFSRYYLVYEESYSKFLQKTYAGYQVRGFSNGYEYAPGHWVDSLLILFKLNTRAK